MQRDVWAYVRGLYLLAALGVVQQLLKNYTYGTVLTALVNDGTDVGVSEFTYAGVSLAGFTVHDCEVEDTGISSLLEHVYRAVAF